ncbi:FHA domain-containing protein [Mesorhizobium sp. KR1-2]|uniref:FHA domain-containing protein n=1 Tax=Mesorhizobium sp. KR1-2 TaxID=3156609 RepID=UPI0032B5935A
MAFSFFSGNKAGLLQTGPEGQSRKHVLNQPETTIGRAPDCDIVVDDPYLAPIHARIERQSDGGFIIRRTGLNVIALNGEALLQTASLKPGDTFRLGKDVEFQYVIKAAKEPKKKEAKPNAATKPGKPLLKRPEFLAAIGVVYLGMAAAVAMTILSGGDKGGDAPSAARIDAVASEIVACIKSARRMRQLSEASFNGAISGRAVGQRITYATLAAAPESTDDAALAEAAQPIQDAYKRAALAGLASEIRGNMSMARLLYQQAFDTVPDINCSAARFAMQRRAATLQQSDE